MSAERPSRGSWAGAIAGGLAFAAAHLLERSLWRVWFDPAGQYPPWFLNSGRATAFTAATMIVAGVLLGGARRADTQTVCWLPAAGGAVLAMMVVLALTGPGTLFPLVITIGGGLLVGSLLAGCALGRVIVGRR